MEEEIKIEEKRNKSEDTTNEGNKLSFDIF